VSSAAPDAVALAGAHRIGPSDAVCRKTYLQDATPGQAGPATSLQVSKGPLGTG